MNKFYVYGHYKEGDIRLKAKGQIPWNKDREGVYSPEHIQFLRDNQTGRTHSQEAKDKMITAKVGRKLSEEHKRKIREGMRKHFNTDHK